MAETHSKIQIFINRDIEQLIKAKQFDAGSRFLDVVLLQDNGSPYDLTDHVVNLNVRKPDSSRVFNNAAITNAPLGEFTVELTDQTLAIGDSVLAADITVFSQDSKQVLTTRTFNIQVQSAIRDDDAIESSNEFGAVVSLFQDVWDMRNTIRRINERFGELTDDLPSGHQQAGVSALGALNRIWNYIITQSSAAIAETVTHIRGKVDTMSSDVANMKSKDIIVYGSAVKKVQRGTAQMPSGSGAMTISITTVNPDKTLVFFNGIAGRSGGGTYYVFPPYLTSLTSTSFSVNALRETTLQFSWQVIEYY